MGNEENRIILTVRETDKPNSWDVLYRYYSEDGVKIWPPMDPPRPDTLLVTGMSGRASQIAAFAEAYAKGQGFTPVSITFEPCVDIAAVEPDRCGSLNACHLRCDGPRGHVGVHSFTWPSPPETGRALSASAGRHVRFWPNWLQHEPKKGMLGGGGLHAVVLASMNGSTVALFVPELLFDGLEQANPVAEGAAAMTLNRATVMQAFPDAVLQSTTGAPERGRWWWAA